MIYVDVHEPEKIVSTIRKLGGEVVVRDQPVDYAIQGTYGSIVVERKAVMTDLARSIEYGQLWDQLETLKIFESEGYIPFLLIEGNFWRLLRPVRRKKKVGGMSLQSLWGIMNSIMLDWMIPVVKTENMDMTANWLISMDRRLGKPAEDRIPALRHKIKELKENPDLMARFIVEGLPGISGELADNLLKHFGTVRKVMSASKEDLMQVKGIGEVKAQQITTILDHIYRSSQRK